MRRSLSLFFLLFFLSAGLSSCTHEVNADLRYSINEEGEAVIYHVEYHWGTACRFPKTIDGYPVAGFHEDCSSYGDPISVFIPNTYKLFPKSSESLFRGFGVSKEGGYTFLKAGNNPHHAILKADLPKEPVNLILPSGVIAIADRAFLNETPLQNAGILYSSLTMNPELQAVGRFAFFGHAFSLDWNGPASITFSPKLSWIGRGAFCGCNMDPKFKLPDAVRMVERGAFHADHPFLPSNCDDGVYYVASESNPHFICTGCEDESSLKNLHDDTKIIQFSFWGPRNNYSIDEYPSHRWSSLHVPKISELDFRGKDVLLTRLDLWREPHTLRRVILPKGRLGRYAFFGLGHMDSLLLPMDLEVIPEFAFKEAGPKTIGYGDVMVEKELHLPPKLRYIYDHAFSVCDTFERVYLPSTLQEIGAHAFDFCYHLRDFYYDGTVAEWLKIRKDPNWYVHPSTIHTPIEDSEAPIVQPVIHYDWEVNVVCLDDEITLWHP